MSECFVSGASSVGSKDWVLIDEYNAVISGNGASKSGSVPTSELMNYSKLRLQASGTFTGASGADDNTIHLLGNFLTLSVPRGATTNIDFLYEGVPGGLKTTANGTPAAGIMLFESANQAAYIRSLANYVSIECNENWPASANIHICIYELK